MVFLYTLKTITIIFHEKALLSIVFFKSNIHLLFTKNQYITTPAHFGGAVTVTTTGNLDNTQLNTG